MTINEIKAKAEMLLKNSRESQGEFVQMYNNGFQDGVNFVLQNLQPCNVSGSLPCHHNYIQKDTYWKSCTHCGMIAPLGQ